jgi:hypothetical protein
MSGVTELLLIGIVLGALLVLWPISSCSNDDSPRDGANHDCEEAWVVEYDGNDDTENETAILEQQWCQRHLQTMEQEAAP